MLDFHRLAVKRMEIERRARRNYENIAELFLFKNKFSLLVIHYLSVNNRLGSKRKFVKRFSYCLFVTYRLFGKMPVLS